MNLPPNQKRFLIRLNEVLIVILVLVAAVALWQLFTLERSPKPVYVAVGMLLPVGLVVTRHWLKQEAQPQVQWVPPTPHSLTPTPQTPRIREKLLNHVQTTWIEGVLQQSIHSEIIKLSLSYWPEAAGQLVLKQKGQSDQPVPPERSLLDIFNRSGRNLLILGEPGSGKTTTMLQLAQALIEAAQENPAEPIPLVFNLSTWAQDQLALTDWLVEEIFVQYGLARELTRSGVAQNQFLYLLDGLDEILDGQARDACIVAINAFKAAHPAELVICSRTADYEALANPLVMGTAVQIQPLPDEQIDAYLSHEGLELQAVRAMLAHDQPLKKLAQTPLMLGLMTLAYQGLSREELQPLADKEARHRHLFDHYVVQMFAKRPLPPDVAYSQEQATTWLANLAQGMVGHGQTIFYMERLQPTWLVEDRWRNYYGQILGLIGRLSGVLSGALIFALIFGLSGRLIFGLIGGLIGGLTVALIVRQKSRSITLVEEVVWPIPSPRTAWAVVKVGLIFGLIFGLIVALIWGLLGMVIGTLMFGRSVAGLIDGLIFGLPRGLMIGLMIGLIVALTEFAGTREMTQRMQPNQGIRRSGWNTIRMGLIFGLIGALMIGLIFGLISGQILGLMIGLMIGLIFGLFRGLIFGLNDFGGKTMIQHYTLRWLLARAGILPYPYPWQDGRLIAFLDAMHERILLRRVGGGWIFIHRSLLEYFAGLAPDRE